MTAELGTALDTARRRMQDARRRTDELFALLRPGALMQRPIPERHRLCFYLGHVEAFDWNLAGGKTLGLEPLHPRFDKLFEFGIDPPPGQLPQDRPEDWPEESAIRDYNARVRESVDRVLPEVPDEILNVVLEHRLMHAETLAYLWHALDYQWKRNGYAADEFSAGGGPVKTEFVDVPEGVARLGQEHGRFGWDNEFDPHEVTVPRFQIARHKVTNADYLRFVRAGAPAPHFWVQREDRWLYRGMFAEAPLPLDWPVYVTHREAQAYAAWAGRRLPSETEIHRAGEGASNANSDFARWEPRGVLDGPESSHGVAQTSGNGWEWTSTVFGPFPGFRTFPYYPGYSKNFFDGDHYVLKGGSPRTAACLMRRSFRNWFRPNYPYVYAAFRLAASV